MLLLIVLEPMPPAADPAGAPRAMLPARVLGQRQGERSAPALTMPPPAPCPPAAPHRPRGGPFQPRRAGWCRRRPGRPTITPCSQVVLQRAVGESG
jgi:hypothetical protein